MKRSLGIFFAGIVLLAACASQPVLAVPAEPGFFMGFFHGFTAIFALAGSIFMRVRIYEFPNSGFWYDFGFVAGFCSSVTAIVLAGIARVGGLLT